MLLFDCKSALVCVSWTKPKCKIVPCCLSPFSFSILGLYECQTCSEIIRVALFDCDWTFGQGYLHNRGKFFKIFFLQINYIYFFVLKFFLDWWFVSQKIGRSRWFASFSTWNLMLAKAISRSDNQRHAWISDSVYSFFCCWAFQVRN